MPRMWCASSRASGWAGCGCAPPRRGPGGEGANWCTPRLHKRRTRARRRSGTGLGLPKGRGPEGEPWRLTQSPALQEDAMSDLKFFYSPGACSLAPHIVLEETDAAYEPVHVALAKGEQRTPEYLRINPKGRVPVLAEGDWVLTENPAILRYVARRFPAAGLWPDDARAEARCAEWLTSIASTGRGAHPHVGRPERYASDPKAIQGVVAKGRETCRDLWGQVEAK